jgi:hypothetical protein
MEWGSDNLLNEMDFSSWRIDDFGCVWWVQAIGSARGGAKSEVAEESENADVVGEIELRAGFRFRRCKLDEDAIGVINAHILGVDLPPQYANGYGYKEGQVISSREQAFYHLRHNIPMAGLRMAVYNYAEDDDCYCLAGPGGGYQVFYFSVGMRVTKKGGSIKTWRVEDAPPEPQIDVNNDYSNLPNISSNPFLTSEDERELESPKSMFGRILGE